MTNSRIVEIPESLRAEILAWKDRSASLVSDRAAKLEAELLAPRRELVALREQITASVAGINGTGVLSEEAGLRLAVSELRIKSIDGEIAKTDAAIASFPAVSVQEGVGLIFECVTFYQKALQAAVGNFLIPFEPRGHVRSHIISLLLSVAILDRLTAYASRLAEGESIARINQILDRALDGRPFLGDDEA